nr:unnamed protein product [Digitaria exilis]
MVGMAAAARQREAVGQRRKDGGSSEAHDGMANGTADCTSMAEEENGPNRLETLDRLDNVKRLEIPMLV